MEKINIHTLFTKWFFIDANISRKVFHDLHLLITSTIWNMSGRTMVKHYGAKMRNCAFSLWHFFYIWKHAFFPNCWYKFFAYPSNDRRYFIIQRLISFSCMHKLFCYVTSIKEMRSIRHSKFTLARWRVKDLLVKAEEIARFLHLILSKRVTLL